MRTQAALLREASLVECMCIEASSPHAKLILAFRSLIRTMRSRTKTRGSVVDGARVSLVGATTPFGLMHCFRGSRVQSLRWNGGMDGALRCWVHQFCACAKTYKAINPGNTVGCALMKDRGEMCPQHVVTSITLSVSDVTFAVQVSTKSDQNGWIYRIKERAFQRQQL
jgi:hypothetical protein